MAVIDNAPTPSQSLKTASAHENALAALVSELQQVKQQLAQARAERQTESINPSASLFQQLFERSSDAQFLMKDGQFSDCNDAAVEILGCENRAQLLSLHPSMISPEYQPDGRLSSEKAAETIAAVSAQGSIRFEWMHRRATGEDFWAEVLLVAVELDEQQLIHATMRDVGDRKLAEAALQQQAVQYRSIFESINDGLLVVDLATGKIVTANPAICKMHGYAVEEFIQLEPSAFIHPDSMPQFADFVADITAGKRYTCEAIDIRKDGTLVDIEVTGVPFAHNDRPNALAVIRDISDRKAAERALADSESYHRTLLDQSSIGLALCRMDGQLVYVNSAYCNILGRLPEDVQKLTYWEMTPEKYVESEQLQLESLLTTGRYGPYEKEYLHKDGHLVPVRLSGTMVKRDGEQFIWSCVEDISDRKAVEEQLEEANTFLNSVVETIPGFFFAKDLQGRHIALNSNLAKFFDRPIAEILGKTDAELLPPDVAAEIMAKDQEIIRTLTTQSFEEVVPANEVDRTFLTIKTPLHDSDGEVIGMIGLAQDISTRKKMEVALRQSEQRFRDVTEAAGEYIWEITADGIYTFVTERVKTVKGYSPSELLGHTLFEFMPEEDIALVGQIVQTAASQKSAFTLEHRNVLPNGEVVWESVSGLPIVNEQGDITGFRGTGLSITERKTFEQAQARLTAILDATSDLVGIADMEGRQLYMNAAGRRMLNIPLDEDVKGTPLDNELPDSAKANVLEQGIPIALRDGIWQGESLLLTRNGQEIPVSQVIISHKNAEGKPEYMSTIIRDITAQKHSEAALQQKALEVEETLQTLQKTQMQMLQSEKMSSLGQLVAGVAHEINNPVNFIYGNIKPVDLYTNDLLNLIELYQTHYPDAVPAIQSEIEAVELDFLKDDLPKTLASMKMGAERIREIVRSLRTFSRLDEAACKAVDIHEGIDSCLVILEHRLKATDARPATPIVKQYGDLPPVECYAGQLNQVLMNILANALDALEEFDLGRSAAEMQQSPSSITISTQTVGADRIAIHLTDNGPGIPDDVKARLFDPFFTTKPVGKGTGMGLSISYQIITEHHGGQLSCVSSPGEGTTFIIEIPIHQNLT